VALHPKPWLSRSNGRVRVLREAHNKVNLSPAGWARIATWGDANAPYYGTYFGRRNLIYKGHPGYRPTPTLASARSQPD